MDVPSRPAARPQELEPPPEVETETLDLGPAPRRPRPVLVVVILALTFVLLAGVVAWRFWPRPVAPVTLEELQGIYAGMVRADGVNDASVVDRTKAPTARVDVTPAACAPLFDTTTFNQFPSAALDGVTTYWMGRPVTTSLFTMRYSDADSAQDDYERVEQALSECADQDVSVTSRRTITVRVNQTPVSTDNGVRAQSGFAYRDDDSSTFAVHVLQFENLLTWQFRYHTSDGAYDPLVAQQLMDSFMSQTRSVLELRA